MDDRSALLAAIIANPDEDTPRLAWADWLQEHGDQHDQARAEFIRLQVEAAKLPDGTKRQKLETAAGKLAEAHRAVWLSPLVPFENGAIGYPPSKIDFSRGLLKYLMIRTGEFLQIGCQKSIPNALASVGVEAIHFYNTSKRVAALASSPAIRWVSRVSYPGPDDAALAAFGASPQWSHLSGLAFDEVKATDAGLKAFAKNSGTTRLQKFGWSCSAEASKRARYTAGGILAVLNSKRFPLFDSLDLEGDQPAKFGWDQFFADAGLKRLTRLRLGTNASMAALASCKNLTSLRELAVNSSLITDSDTETLLGNKAFAKLTKLEMYGMNWGHPRLSKPVERRLRDRFGPDVLKYSPEQK